MSTNIISFPATAPQPPHSHHTATTQPSTIRSTKLRSSKTYTTMSPAIKNIAFVGATGELGVFFVDEFQKSGTEFNVTVLTRKQSEAKTKDQFANKPQFTVRGVDYADELSLVDALTGQDAVLSTIAGEALLSQIDIARAAEKAGVKYFIPSGFGSDINHPGNKDVTLFAPKRAVQKALHETSLGYVIVSTGFFVDHAIDPSFGWDLASHKVNIVGDGTARNTYTARSDVAKYTIAALKRVEELRNKDLRIGSYHLSTNDLVEIINKLSGSQLAVTHTPVEEVEAIVAKDKQESGGWNTVLPQLSLVLARGDATINWGDNKLDNDKFPEITPAPIEFYVKQALSH
ncbi:NAD(P)-binding protein [Martensiomyces pterosporus]|nr:NAD(P)-binding protein [Martensiomyces pterosporus]